MTMHYHGTPITPGSVLETLAGRNFCVSYAAPHQVEKCHQIGQSVMLDNGAFTFWKQGGTPDWDSWRAWAEPWLAYKTTWCVLPDVVDGGADANDRLLQKWGRFHWAMQGAPVWHLDEPLSRLRRLAHGWERICFGSSGQYAEVGSEAWHRRVTDAFNHIVNGDGSIDCWVHMLRGMSLAGDIYPFASVDSTDIARNHHVKRNARAMADRWDAMQCPARWTRVDQLELEEVA